MTSKKKTKTARVTRSKPRTRAAQGSPIERAKLALEAILHSHVQAHQKHGRLEYEKRIHAERRNIVGVAVGHAHASKGTLNSHSGAPGDDVLLVLLAEDRSHNEVRDLLKELLGSKAAALGKLPIEVLVTGTVRAHGQAFQMRPAAAGTSVGNCRVESGTFGFLAKGRTPPRDTQRFVISNTHVLTSLSGSAPGEGVCQPGPNDGGSCPTQQIAALDRFVPINFGGPNKVDAASARAVPGSVRSDILFMQGSTPTFARVGPPIEATGGMIVGKSGRSTGVTTGQVFNTSTSVIATYGARSAFFVNQMLVRGINGAFSDPGDSGALVWTWNPARNPVGLLFGGGNGVSFVNHLQDVLDALDVDIA